MSESIGIGVIGMGWMGIQHSRGFQQIPDRFPEMRLKPRLVVCADTVETRAREAQQRLGFEKSTTEWTAVINDPAVDAITVATPNATHLEIVRAAAQVRKPVLCEKPVGSNPTETKQIARIARKAGILTFTGLNYRWAPLVQHASNLIQSGRLGRLTHYRGRFFAGYASDPNGVLSWRFRKDQAGLGTLGDLMSHVIDMAHMLAGPIVCVIGTEATFIPQRPQPRAGGTHFDTNAGGPLSPVTNEDYVGVLVKFANGARGTLEACRVIQGPQCQMAWEANGTEGALAWDFERMNELETYFHGGANGERKGFERILSGPEHPFHTRFNPGPGIGLGYEDLKTIEAYHFLKSIQEGKQGCPGFEEILQVGEVQEAVERSWHSRHWEPVESLHAALASEDS